MTRLLLFLCALLLVAGCGTTKTTLTAREAARAYYDVSKKDLNGSSEEAAILARYRSCRSTIAQAPAARRADIRYEAQAILSSVALTRLPPVYHRFAADLAKIDVTDKGLLAIRREVQALDAELQRKQYPKLDICGFLQDWKRAGWSDTAAFEHAWLAKQGWDGSDAIGAQIGSGVDAVAPDALRRLGLSQVDADAFTRAAEVYYDPS